MRQLRKAVRERAEIDHSWAGDGDDGKHKQISFVNPLGGDPSTVTDEGFLYTKNVSSVVELFWKDEAGNVLQLTAVGVVAAFPSDTLMLFQQAVAQTGGTT